MRSYSGEKLFRRETTQMIILSGDNFETRRLEELNALLRVELKGSVGDITEARRELPAESLSQRTAHNRAASSLQSAVRPNLSQVSEEKYERER